MAVDEASCAELAVTLAVAAGELIREAFETSSNNAFELKTENDHVTAVDLACERLILDGLRARFPSHQFIGEESTDQSEVPALTDAPTWLVDPLDGTTNFVHGYAHCAVSIGLCVGGEPVVAVVRDPMRRETFLARRGHGLLLGNRRVGIASSVQALDQAIMSIEWPSSAADRSRSSGSGGSATALQLALLGRLLDAPHSLSALRGGGSCVLDLAWVACGRLNLTYRGHVGCSCWDVCAGALLVTEGGGALSGPAADEPFDLMTGQFIAAGTAPLLLEFQQCVHEAQADLDALGGDGLPRPAGAAGAAAGGERLRGGARL